MTAFLRVRHAVHIGLNAPDFFAKQRDQFGNTFFVQVPGLNRVLFTSEPEYVSDLFQFPSDVMSSSLPSPIQPLLGERSLILVQGDAHRDERRLLKPAFQGQCLIQYNRFIEDAIETSCKQLQSDPVAQTWMQDVTLDVILRAVFGEEEVSERAEFAAACRRLIGSYTALLLLFPNARFNAWGFSPWDRFLSAREVLDEQIYRVLDRSITRKSDSVVGRLMEEGAATDLHDPKVRRDWRDRLTTLLLAGFETTANTLAWTLYHLTQHPEWQDRIAVSLGRADSREALTRHAMKQPELDSFCKEVMRLHPVVPLVIRSVLSPVEWAGRSLSPGEYAGVATLNIHTDPTLYPDPMRFDPARFLDAKPKLHEYVPFGGGEKKCLGYGFALHEIKIVIATILTRFRIALTSPVYPKPRIQGLALMPKPEIRLTLSPR
ncbi:cytochrome P450 [Hoeflea sp. WL0058]|uniref:Cytochrome P450 n=1 Tax=Flavimaribacter sediminis TaxID=2865987 RepID=A0AAE2ZGI8_9HYPH|nr:cytochrome P450 [Flavimaribacter sediminis]MBW8636169.1 cytochrome P450 [Flavimaribacter sediminis]